MKLLNAIIQMLKGNLNILDILKGYYNLVFKTKNVEAVSAARMKICSGCPFIDTEGSKCMVPGTQPCCSVCGCSLDAATRSLSYECPKGFWKAVLTPEEEAKQNNKLGI